jgi:chorismate mutase/prephenate dehydratase
MNKGMLEQIRDQIDALDEQIQSLINERAQLAQQIAALKRESNDSSAFYRPEREAQILRQIQARNKGPLSDEEIARLFREIMSACLALEQPMNIAYLGPQGTFTELAVLKHFGQAINTRSMSAIDEVFREVEAGTASYGVVPIENSTEGMVNHTLDLFVSSPLKICGEVLLRVHHHLLSNAAGLQEVKQVMAHQQALAQCREWLGTHLPGVERIAVSSNAEAAKIAAKTPGVAALGSEHAGQIYNLGLLASNIEDEPDNTTRFLVIGEHNVPASGDDKTSIMVAVKNKAGALFDIITPLSNYEINMTRIESRPSRRSMWDYVFFIDIIGHVDDMPVKRALRAVEQEAALLKLLGSYPSAVL